MIQIIEDELAKIEEVREIRATARLGFGHLIVGLESHVYDTDSIWDRVRVALDEAKPDIFPNDAGPIELRRPIDGHARHCAWR